MKQVSNQDTTRIVIVLTVFLFLLGYLLVVTAGIADIRHMLSFLVSSYLIVWGVYSLASPVPRAEIRSQFLLMSISLGVALVVVEVPAWLKLIDYRKSFLISGSLPWQQPGYLPDPELLAKPAPHHSVQLLFDRGNIGQTLCLPTREAAPFELRYDQHGFRNDQDYMSADIAVIGDSYVESQMTPGPMLATTLLEGLTQKTVANLGQSGYGPQQELAVLRRYALPLHPRSVVWVFFEGNDLLDAEEYVDKVSFLKSNWNSLDTAWDRSFTRNALSWLTGVIQGCVPSRTVEFRTARGIVWDIEGREHQLYVKGRSRSAGLTKRELDALKTSVAAIEEAYRLVQKEGARLIVVFAPTAFRVYHEIANFEKDMGDVARWDLNDLPDRLHKMMAEISPDIVYLDLTPVLQSAARNNTLVFLPDDTHWTSEGHRVVAEALAEALSVERKIYAENQSSEPKEKSESILSTDAVMVRNLDGTIRYWSKGAQKLYGWEPHEVVGTSAHHLLKTVFPVPLQVIEGELRTTGHWKGQLVHERRDGGKITVVSDWDLQQDASSQDRSITVVEVNGLSPS